MHQVQITILSLVWLHWHWKRAENTYWNLKQHEFCFIKTKNNSWLFVRVCCFWITVSPVVLQQSRNSLIIHIYWSIRCYHNRMARRSWTYCSTYHMWRRRYFIKKYKELSFLYLFSLFWRPSSNFSFFNLLHALGYIFYVLKD